MSRTHIAIAVASLALVSTGASAQVGFRIGGGGIGIGLGVPLYGGQERPRSVERYRAPQTGTIDPKHHGTSRWLMVFRTRSG